MHLDTLCIQLTITRFEYVLFILLPGKLFNKRSVMIIPYNVSMTGIGDQLIEHFYVEWINNESKMTVPGKFSKGGR